MADEHVSANYFIAEEDDHLDVSNEKDFKKHSLQVRKKGSKRTQDRVELAQLDPKNAHKHLFEIFYKANPNASALEKKAFVFPQEAVLCKSGDKSIMATVESFPSFEKICKSLQCQVLVLSSSAGRCVQVLKDLSGLRQKCKIGKLFAKHLKLDDQIKFLKSDKVPIAIGTPGRISTILGCDPRCLGGLKYIIIDMLRDVKLRSVLDIPETRDPLFDIIFKKLIDKVKSGSIKIAFAE